MRRKKRKMKRLMQSVRLQSRKMLMLLTQQLLKK